MTPDQIRKKREKSGLSISDAARIVYVSERNWRRWESGDRQMPAAAWELFTIKTGDQSKGDRNDQ